MAKAIRQAGLKAALWLHRLFARPASAGWQPSRRPPTLRGS